jgi:hypothetical protein
MAPGLSAIRNLSCCLAAQRMNGGDDGTRNRGLCRDSCVNRSYSNLQDTRGLPNAAQVIREHSNCGLKISTCGSGIGYRRLARIRKITNLEERELRDLPDAVVSSFMRDARRVSRALAAVTGAPEVRLRFCRRRSNVCGHPGHRGIHMARYAFAGVILI